MTGVIERKAVWTDDYKIHSYDVDFRGVLSIPQLCRFFQETAYHHAENLGVGYTFLKEKKIMWVLASLLVEIKKYPQWDEEIRIHTWPSFHERLFYFRDFKITNSAGAECIKASSKWVVIDWERRRPVRTDKLDEFQFKYNNWQFPKWRGKTIEGIPNKLEKEYRVEYNDVDLNRHVNNATYIEWVLGCYPLNFFDDHAIKTLEINFLAEAFYSDIIDIISLNTEGNSDIHSVSRRADGKEICKMNFLWEKRKLDIHREG